MKNNSAGNARQIVQIASTAVHKVHEGLIKTNAVQDLSEGDLSAPIVGTWDTLLRNVISFTDILQDTQRQEQVPFLTATRILLWLIKFLMVQTKMMGKLW